MWWLAPENGAPALFALVLIHVTWGATRLPGRVVGRRLDDVRAYREEGAARYLLQSSGMRGEDAIEWVLENTPPDSVVLWRGSKLGPLEFAPTLGHLDSGSRHTSRWRRVRKTGCLTAHNKN